MFFRSGWRKGVSKRWMRTMKRTFIQVYGDAVPFIADVCKVAKRGREEDADD